MTKLLSVKIQYVAITIAINPTKETNIRMILLSEDIQQLRKIKGTGEQTFNFSTLRAAFKGVWAEG